MAVGATLPTSGRNFPLSALHSTYLSTYRPVVTHWTLLSVAGVLACVGVALVVLRLPGRAFLPASMGLALASRMAVNVSRRGPAELAYPFTGPERHNEYIASIPLYRHDPLAFLHDYPDLGPRLAEHPAGHPAGATMLFGALAQIGLPGAWPEVVLILLLGAATAPLTWLLARTLVDDGTARLATVLWIFAPSVLIESATSADAVYAFVGVVTALLLVRHRTLLGAAAAALGTFLSYALAAIPVWACLVLGRRDGPRRAIRVAAATVASVCGFYAALWLATGYDPVAAYRATEHRYSVGAGHRRPYWFWLFGDPAAFGLGLGVPTLLGLARSLSRRFVPALAVAAIVVAAALSGYTKAEVERIWLFLTPLAAIAAAPALARWPPAVVLAVLSGQALVVEVLFRTPW
jgi:methylthioxylose transferase